jgi:hypothetical protein
MCTLAIVNYCDHEGEALKDKSKLKHSERAGVQIEALISASRTECRDTDYFDGPAGIQDQQISSGISLGCYYLGQSTELDLEVGPTRLYPGCKT